MGWADNYVKDLKSGKTVAFRPKGNSMKPKIHSGDLVTVSSDLTGLAEGSIVLCRVKGRQYLHFVKAVKEDGDKRTYLIGNNRGGINGWIGLNGIYGCVTDVTGD